MRQDPLTDQQLKRVYPPLAKRWRLVRQDVFEELGLQPRVTHDGGLRSHIEQWKIYGKGRKLENKVWVVTDIREVGTWAKPGESLHNFGLALDIAFFGKDPYLEKNPEFDRLWKRYGKICDRYGLEWGGNWPGKKKDRPHCQLSCGLSLSILQMAFEKGGLPEVFKKCDIILSCGRDLV